MIRIGIIGVGKMGLSHLAVANRIGDIEVVAVTDTSVFVCNALNKFGKYKIYSDYRKMLEKEILDGVIISLPTKMHYEACMLSIEKGISFFVEKPFTLDPDRSAHVLESAKSKNVFGMVGYVNRYASIFCEIKKIIESGILGNINHYESIMLGNVVGPDSKNSWRHNVSEGGGCLYDYGSHAIDLAIFYFDEIINVKEAKLKNIFSKGCEDLVEAIVEHKNGISGRIYVNWSDLTQRKAYNQILIFGTNGELIANKQEMRVYINHIKEDNTFKFKQGWNIRYITDYSNNVPFYLRGEEYTREILEFVKMVKEKKCDSISSISNAIHTDIAIKKIREKSE